MNGCLAAPHTPFGSAAFGLRAGAKQFASLSVRTAFVSAWPLSGRGLNGLNLSTSALLAGGSFWRWRFGAKHLSQFVFAHKAFLDQVNPGRYPIRLPDRIAQLLIGHDDDRIGAGVLVPDPIRLSHPAREPQ